MPGVYAPPAVLGPKTAVIDGMPSFDRWVMLRNPAPPGTKMSACRGSSAPADSLRVMVGSRLARAISSARALLATLVGLADPPR